MTSRRITKTIERARPLRSSTISTDLSYESILSDMDYVTQCLNDNSSELKVNIYKVITSIVDLCDNLKKYGSKLEQIYKDQLDRCYVSLRNGCREDMLPTKVRFRLLEVIELRAMHWEHNENHKKYYRNRFTNGEFQTDLMQETYPPNINLTRNNPTSPTATPVNPYSSQSTYQPMQQTQTSPSVPTLAQGQILKNSGKFTKPTRVPGKNLYKDEVVIRNVDSGKVNPGARERLVQITGPTEDNLRHASQLIEDTIVRNASPIRDEPNTAYSNMGGSSPTSSQTSDDAYQHSFLGGNAANKKVNLNDVEEPIGEYRYTVVQGNESIRITGTNLALVKRAKLILEECFRSEQDINKNSNIITSDLDESFGNSLSSPVTSSCSPTTDHQNNGSGLQNNNHIHSHPVSHITVDPAPLSSNMTLTVIRKPLIPMYSKCDLEIAEKEDTATTKEAKMRRALFAQTSQQTKSNDGSLSPVSNGVCPQPSRITYRREFLAARADSRLSRLTPKDWSKVIRTYPAVIKKSYHHLATLIATMNDRGDGCMNESESYLSEEDLHTSEEILAYKNKKWTLLRKSSFQEDEAQTY